LKIPKYRKTYWHTCSHVLAQAVKRLYPDVKLAIGPAIDDGFYYDFDAPFNFTQEHLDALEAEMRKICKEKAEDGAVRAAARRGRQVHAGEGRAL
jgi:threonyl-tRNA synthetase